MAKPSHSCQCCHVERLRDLLLLVEELIGRESQALKMAPTSRGWPCLVASSVIMCMPVSL